MNLFSRLKRIGAGNKSSVTLPVTVPVPSHNENEEDTPEIYKVIGEDKLPANRNNREAASTADIMVKEEKFVPDGADEEMLGSGGGDEKLAERRDEVKFIKGDHQNGDAKIDIGNLNGAKPEFTGMSKEELLKYANDPFWVRLRWIFFLGFWAIWVAMLVGAILIIIGAPKCAAPQPLPWYKRGPHAKFGLVGTAKTEDVSLAKKLSATGAIYELPALLTYEVKKADVEAQIKHLVDLYQNSEVKVILDITPNFVGEDSQLVKDALDNAEKRSALIWVNGTGQDVPNKWLKVGGSTTAWGDLKGNFVLSQFEPGTYDLKMSSKIVRHELSSALQHLIGLGVQGFRLKNTKFFLINDNLDDETISPLPKDNNLMDYTFYTHTQTTFQPGLGDLLYDYLGVVKNASSEAFLSVAEDIVRPDAYELSQAGGALGIDLPMYGQFMKTVGASQQKKNLVEELQQTFVATRNVSWLQWNFGDIYVDTPTHPSALALFMSLLPGVPIVPVDSIAYTNVTQETYSQIKDLRLSASYMHGELQIFESKKLIAFSRIKSGNPGYFVIFNPTDLLQNSTFSADHKLPDKMTVSYFSENYNDKNNNGTHVAHSAKVNINELQIPAHSAIVLTYVPVKSE